MARLPIDGTWRYSASSKALTRNGVQVKFSYYAKRPSGIHRATDIGASNGTPVRAVYGGKVVRIGYDGDGWGRYLRIRDAAGHEHLYAHLKSDRVSLGQSVPEGYHIAYADNTGNSSGPHLHYEFWWVAGSRSSSIDPFQLFVRIAAPAVPAPYPTPNWANNYRRGNSGAAVMFIQYALADWRVDGIFDSTLESKVKAFQKSRGISQSGVVGTRTGPLLARIAR